jgi:hypothetical protein
MIRTAMGDSSYWDSRTKFLSEAIIEKFEMLAKPSVNPVYDPQFAFDLSRYCMNLMLRRYSRGDPISELGQHFSNLLDAWELSNQLSDDICREHNLETCRDWVFDLSNLNHYNWCFWLIGLALALDIPDDQWRRLLVLIGGEGEDELLDRIVASRQPERNVGSALLHKKPYARLLKAIDAPKEKQASLLLEFVENWYVELARKGKDELWWYIYGDPEKHPLEKGSYFGRWCVEAVAAVKAFGIDDSLCLGHEHYPGDLLRPDGPTTHPQRKPKSFISRLFNRS